MVVAITAMPATANLPVSMLICSRCRELYTEPRTLPCLHSFCHQCILQLPVFQDDEDRSVFDCPQCSQRTLLPEDGASGFLSNEFLARLCHNYVGDVQKTLASAGRPFSPEPQSPRSPPAGASPTVPGKATALGQHSISLSNLARDDAAPPLPLSHRTTPFSPDGRRGSAPMDTLSSSCTNLSSPFQPGNLAAGGVLPDHVMSSSGVGIHRRLNATPSQVVEIYEELQRKLNRLQSASLQLSYSLENINQAEQKWQQKKEDLKRDVKRRSTELQFFIKRQERMLLTLLDTKDMDDGFNSTADKARADLRSSLRDVAQQRNMLKTVLDFATDSELISLGGMLLDNQLCLDPVAMIAPELIFSTPERGSTVEDIMERDFGALTTTLVTHKIFTPEENWEPDIAEEEEEEKEEEVDEEEEEEEEEVVVTEIYDVEIPQASTVTTTIVEQNVTAASNTFSDSLENHNVSEPICQITIEEESIQEEQQAEEEEKDKEEEEEGEEESEEEEVMMVEEVCEFVNGELIVISRTVRLASETMSASNKEETEAGTEDQEEGKGMANHHEEEDADATDPVHGEKSPSGAEAEAEVENEEVTVSVVEQSEERVIPRWRANIDIGRQDKTLHNVDKTSNGVVQSQVANHVTTESKIRTTTFEGQNSNIPARGHEPAKNTIHTGTGQADKTQTTTTSSITTTTTANETSSETEVSEHVSTLNRFQSFRESLRKRRRELLSSTVLTASADQDPVELLHRERRGPSLERSAAYIDPTTLSHVASLEQQQSSMVTVRDSSLPRRSAEGRNRAASFRRREAGAAASEDVSASSNPGRPSRPVRRAISAASDKASKVEFLKETWRKRRELLIQNDAYSVYNPSIVYSQDPDALQGNDGKRLSIEDRPGSRVREGVTSGLTSMAETVKRSGKAEEGVLQPRTPRTHLPEAGAMGISLPLLTPSASHAGGVADAQALKTVDSILQRKNIIIPEPKSPPAPVPPLSPNNQQASPTSMSTIGTKPSMMVKPLIRDPSTLGATCVQFNSPLETLQEDDTRMAEFSERRPGLRCTSPGPGEDGSKDMMQQVKANMRRKKERWRSLSLT